jgi:hypothetical protein
VEALRKIDVKFAAGVMMVLVSAVVVFHLLILTGAIPFNVVWGGRLENASRMYVFEAVSITINLAVIAVVGIKGGFIKFYLPKRIVTFLLWVLVILFTVNTIGNLFAKTALEMFVFTPLTLISAILCYRMAMDN